MLKQRRLAGHTGRKICLDAMTAATIVWLKEGQQRKPMTSATRLDDPLRVRERLITGAEECTERERAAKSTQDVHFNNNKERRGGDADVFFLKGEGKKKGEKTTPRKEDSTGIAERGDRMLKKTNNEVDLKTGVSKKKNNS